MSDRRVPLTDAPRDGTQYARTSGAWTAVSSGLANIVEDTTPQLGGALDTNGFDIDVGDGNNITFLDSTNTDTAVFSHDGTNFNTSFATTSLWSVDMAGTAAGVTFGSSGAAKVWINTIDSALDVRDGWKVRIRDAGDTDYADFSHDGTDFNTAFTNTTDWNLSGITAFRFGDLSLTSAALDIKSTGTTASIELHSNTASYIDFSLDGTGATDFGARLRYYTDYLQVDGAGLRVADGNTFRVNDSTNANYMELSATANDLKFSGNQHIWLSPPSGHMAYVYTSGVSGDFRVYDGTGVDYVRLQNDGTYSNIETGSTELRIANQAGSYVLQTHSTSDTGNTTGFLVRNHAGEQWDVGMNQLPPFNFNASDTIEAQHCGAMTGKTNTTSYTLTGPASSDLDFPVGGAMGVANFGSSTNYTINDTATCTMYYCDSSGVTDIAGSGTLAPGGVITLYRYSSTAIYIWGNGFTA